MLLGFRMDVTKLDRDIAYVAMVVHVCYKLMFPMFHLFFYTYVVKCVYLIILHMFHT